MIPIKLLCNFIEIVLRHGCSPVNLPRIFRAPFSKNTSGRLLLQVDFISGQFIHSIALGDVFKTLSNLNFIQRQKVVNYFPQTLYFRCLTGFWICLSLWIFLANFSRRESDWTKDLITSILWKRHGIYSYCLQWDQHSQKKSYTVWD